MLNLTRQQQIFLCVLLVFLALGWAVKAWRTAHPPAQTAAPVSMSVPVPGSVSP